MAYIFLTGNREGEEGPSTSSVAGDGEDTVEHSTNSGHSGHTLFDDCDCAGSVTSVQSSNEVLPAYGALGIREDGVSRDHDYSDSPVPVEQLLQACHRRIEELESRLEAVNVERFGLERFSSNTHMIKFYTGFPNYECLSNFFRAIAPVAVNVKTWSQVKRSSSSTQYRNSVGKLLPIDQLFMFLHKLRLGSLDQDLADKFSVSQSTVSRNTITWANLLYVILGSQPLWPRSRKGGYVHARKF